MPDLPALQIGGLQLAPPVMLAPMAGYTDLPFRTICRRCGAPMVCTELIMSEGVIRYDPRTMSFLDSDTAERPVAVQFYGTDPQSMAEAARIAESMNRFAAVDLNFGCPHRRILRKGAGAALMENPEQAYRVVKAVREATSLPLTVKTRLGLFSDRPLIYEIVRAAEDGGADALAIHARFAEQRHSGRACWNTLAEVKAGCRIPIIGNGGLAGAADVMAMARQTGVDGMMIGRAAIGNPWIFGEIIACLNGEEYIPPDDERIFAMIEEHLVALYTHMARINSRRRREHPDIERAACHRFLAHLVKYLRGRKGLRQLLAACGGDITIDRMLNDIRRLIERTSER